MPKEKLKQTLNRLGDELRNLPDDGVRHQRRLKELHEQASAYLDGAAEIGQEEHHTLLHNLQDMAKRLEVSHPDLTDGINQVLGALSNMGI